VADIEEQVRLLSGQHELVIELQRALDHSQAPLKQRLLEATRKRDAMMRELFFGREAEIAEGGGDAE
jgi:hypothetical protein